jgi:sugar O-acyltransferase (sialic acid O-acetyltransferase NeuD family)
MVEDIVIVGAGGLGREVSLLIDIINQKGKRFNKLGFYDDGVVFGTEIGDLKVLGTVEDLNNIQSFLNVVVAVGNPKSQRSINQKFNNKLLNFPNIIHPDLNLDNRRSTIGIGNIFAEGFAMTCDITIGNFNIFNIKVLLGHDVRIGNFNVLNPNTQISGEVTIKDANLFGAFSCVLQGLSIGSNNLIGACSLLTRRINDDQKYFGIPAKRLNE